MISIKNLNFAVGDKVLYENFNLTVEDGEVLALVSPSGNGKSSLLNLLCGFSFENAKIKYDELKVEGKISYLFQENRLIEHVSVKKNIMLPLEKKVGKKEAEKIAEKFIKMTALEDKKDEIVKVLSGGENQRVALARAFAFPSDILFLDEPFHALDLKLKSTLIEMFRALLKENRRTVIFVSHDMAEVEMFATRKLILGS